jgi:hypothetical protein
MPFCSNKTRTCYCGKRREWEEEDAKLAAEGKQNPWEQFPGRSRPYLRARVGKKKNTSEGSGGITFSNPAVVGVVDRVKTLAAQGSDGEGPIWQTREGGVNGRRQKFISKEKETPTR